MLAILKLYEFQIDGDETSISRGDGEPVTLGGLDYVEEGSFVG
jgi:hypothetical protein